MNEENLNKLVDALDKAYLPTMELLVKAADNFGNYKIESYGEYFYDLAQNLMYLTYKNIIELFETFEVNDVNENTGDDTFVVFKFGKDLKFKPDNITIIRPDLSGVDILDALENLLSEAQFFDKFIDEYEDELNKILGIQTEGESN